MRRSILAAVALAAAGQAMLVHPVREDMPGVQVSISAGGLNYVLTQLIPVIEAKIGGITIPDISGEKDGFEYSLTNLACQKFAIGSASATFGAPSSIAASLDNIAITCSGDWSFKLHSWPHIPDGGGSIDISVSNTNAAVGVTVGESGGHPVLATTAANCNINIGSVDISFHGSNWDVLLDLFKSLIEDELKKTVQGQFSGIISNFVTSDCNAELAKIPLALPIHVRYPYNISEIRFALTSAPTATATFIGVQLQGDIVPVANPVAPPIAPPTLPPFDTGTGQYFVTADISSYTLLSAAYTYWSAGLMSWAIPSTSMPLGLNNSLAYALIAPGFPVAYPKAPVSLALSIGAMPTLNISAAGVLTAVPFTIAFQVPNAATGAPLTAFSIIANAGLALSLAAGQDPNGPAGSLALTGNLSYLNANLTAGPSSVGPVSVGLLQDLISFIFPNFILPAVNQQLANGVPLPSLDGLAFTQAAITESTGYLALGADFTYNPSQSEIFGAILKRFAEAAAAAAAEAQGEDAAPVEVRALRGQQ